MGLYASNPDIHADAYTRVDTHLGGYAFTIDFHLYAGSHTDSDAGANPHSYPLTAADRDPKAYVYTNPSTAHSHANGHADATAR